MDEINKPLTTISNWTEDQLKELDNLQFELEKQFLLKRIISEKFEIMSLSKAIKDLQKT
jgi:hypothetical protein